MGSSTAENPNQVTSGFLGLTITGIHSLSYLVGGIREGQPWENFWGIFPDTITKHAHDHLIRGHCLTCLVHKGLVHGFTHTPLRGMEGPRGWRKDCPGRYLDMARGGSEAQKTAPH